MQDKAYIIQQLNIGEYPPEQQEVVLEQVLTLVGEAISNTLSEQQLHEYAAIVNADSEVTQLWLEQNTPEYKNTDVFKALEAGTKDDPEHNDPAKLFANLAWVEKNVPNKKEIIDRVIEAYKHGLDKTT